jgi:uncharacterized cupredoxin-like copper-binding protein
MQAIKSTLLRFSVIALAMAVGSYVVVQQSSFAHEGHDFAAGEPGNKKRTSRTIMVTMTEADGKMLFAPNRIEVRRGEQIKFVLTNAGYLDHEFMIATPEENKKHAELMQKYPDMEHDDPNGRTVKTKQKGELIWRFTKSGTFEFACLIPGHYEAGMYGTIIVK